MKLGKGPSNPFGWGLHNLHLHGIRMCAVVLLAWNHSTFNPIVPGIEGNISRNPLFWLLVWRPMGNQSPITNPMMGFLVNSYQLTRWHQRWCSDPPFSMKCYGVDGEPCVKNVGTSTEIGNPTFEKELHYPNLSKLNLKLGGTGDFEESKSFRCLATFLCSWRTLE